ncbi:hypothetical protein PQQ51_05875 [Paraburkholderia xenovorans]
MRAALTVFVLIASLAVHSCLASHLGARQAVPLAFAAAALLTFLAVKHEAARPVALRIGPQGLSAWDRAGRLVAQGRIAGCSQWSSRLLVLALAPEQGRPHTLLVAADALPRPVFRELAVRGRHAAGA